MPLDVLQLVIYGKISISCLHPKAHARVMQIHFQFTTTKKGKSSITEYFQTLKSWSDTLAVARHHLSDFKSQSFLLACLGSDYDPFVTSVHTGVDPLSIDKIFSHLLAQEMRIE